MFDRTEKSEFRESKMTDRAAEIVNGDEYAFLYAHKWLNPESLSWRIIGAPQKAGLSKSFTFIYNYTENYLTEKEVF
jgi:hypothetical protein